MHPLPFLFLKLSGEKRIEYKGRQGKAQNEGRTAEEREKRRGDGREERGGKRENEEDQRKVEKKGGN